MDNYGMTPEEAQKRAQLIANLLASGDPTNISVAQMIANGPYRANGGPGQPAPAAPSAPSSYQPPPMGVSMPSSYVSSGQQPTIQPVPQRGAADIMSSSPIAPPSQAPAINPTNPAARSGLGQVVPQPSQSPSAYTPSAMSNSDYPFSPNYRQPSQAPVSINVNITPSDNNNGMYGKDDFYHATPQFSLSPQQQANKQSVYDGTAPMNVPLPSFAPPQDNQRFGVSLPSWLAPYVNVPNLYGQSVASPSYTGNLSNPMPPVLGNLSR